MSAYAPSGTFDMTEENVVEIEKKKLGDIQENEEVQLERKKILLREELKNILPRIDFVMQMKNPKNEKEVWYFQKQVNTDGTSKTGWYPITSTTYNFAQKRVNVKDI